MNNKENAYQIFTRIKENVHNNRMIIGIDGLSRSGKTTLVHELKTMLTKANIPHLVIHMDDHIVTRLSRYNTGYEQWYEYYSLQWDINWLRENLFKKLRVADYINLPFYDEHTDCQIDREVIVKNTKFIIIEGVFLQRSEWRAFFDLIVYLDCARMKRFARESVETQSNREKFTNRYWKAEDYYLNTIHPIQNADIVLNREE
ncbi:kinase [Caldibacillus lycopersici]|uniref:Kinase n=1 Tax=Perspicuibacillus lycopersici TaxID=1325689 RepID=A0AAE3IPG9_9BACI|nr:kinase [Perspicuibacillus lycopersici]MCU9611986.1 kinase [Perspicuibacillus lycopersici]